MRKRAAKKGRGQGVPRAMSLAFQQLALPMMVASEAVKQGLLAFVLQMGMLAFRELLAAENEAIAGAKGEHQQGRAHHHWGSVSTAVPFGGRRVVIDRPRVRRKGKGGKEVELPSIAAARATDPVPAHVAEQAVLGVSTRGYRRSLEEVDESLETRGDSKSHVSRALIERTAEKLADFVDRRLDDLELAAMFIDGIEIAKHAAVAGWASWPRSAQARDHVGSPSTSALGRVRMSRLVSFCRHPGPEREARP